MKIRPIHSNDNFAMRLIIESSMKEFDLWDDGHESLQKELKDIKRAYTQHGSAFFVVEENGKIYGGGGIAKLAGAEGVCELRKMYLDKAARGKGWGTQILRTCLASAKELGYQFCYLETSSNMHAAQHVYKREGFLPRKAPLGFSGNFSCNAWFEKVL